MLTALNRKLKRLCSCVGWPIHCRSKPEDLVKSFRKLSSDHKQDSVANGSATMHRNGQSNGDTSGKLIRIATFNAALFSMAPAVPKTETYSSFDSGHEDHTMSNQQLDGNLRKKSANERPKSILKQSPSPSPSPSTDRLENLSKQQKFMKSKLRVSINLPVNEISLRRSAQLSSDDGDEKQPSLGSRSVTGKGSFRFTMSLPSNLNLGESCFGSKRTVVDVLGELDADILGLQEVKAAEENGMKPLSDLAAALGMYYVFAESWAPEYGNAVLSKWPIKRWKVQKIFDDSDYRNVLKATIDVPEAGEVNFHCTHLDHLDENWRMKQINAMIQSNDGPHILAGGINSLDETDYSLERWTDIVKFYEEIGKPTPKVEVMKFLKSKQYTDAKDFAGECESVIMIAKGQSVQGTCKYGTRVDYVLALSDSPYKFVPGSYSVFSSKGTSDHHIVKVDMLKEESSAQQCVNRKQQKHKQRTVKT